jgi:hypothetical protein
MRTEAFTLQEALDAAFENHVGESSVIHTDDGRTLHSLSSVVRYLDDGLPIRQHKRVAHTPLYTTRDDHRDRTDLEHYSRMAVPAQARGGRGQQAMNDVRFLGVS